MLKRQLPATWMYFWLLSAQSFKVFGLLFALWKYRKEQIQTNAERSRNKFEEELFGVEQKALHRNPDLMLNTIQIYFKMLEHSEPHRRNISVLAKLLVTNPQSVFSKRSEIDTSEGVLLFDKIDRDGNGVLTRKEIMSYLSSVSRKQAVENLSTITGCDQSVLSMFIYALEHLSRKSHEVDENSSLDLAKGDYWLMLVEKGDERAVEIDQIRLHLLDFLEKAQDCHERNVPHQDSDAMKNMLLEQPLSKNIAKRSLKYLEPLMMACYRRKKHEEKVKYTRSSAFDFLEEYYDIGRSGTVDPYNPTFSWAEKIVRYPKVGDRVIVTKNGSQYVFFLLFVCAYDLTRFTQTNKQKHSRYGNLATVNDPYWFGRVKVVMDDGGIEKSYLFSKGEIEVLTTEEEEVGE